MIARGRMRVRVMNHTEAAYGEHLHARQIAGEVAWFAFEAIKLRLAPATFYTPDFFVMLADGTLQVEEVKGHWEDDARVKIKVAASMFPFRFIAVQKAKGGGWTYEIFEARPAPCDGARRAVRRASEPKAVPPPLSPLRDLAALPAGDAVTFAERDQILGDMRASKARVK